MSENHKVFWRNLMFPIWKFIIGGPPFVYGWFAFIRDEFLPSETADRLRIGGFINVVNWYWWVIGGVIILWVITAWDAAKKTSETKTDYRQTHMGNGDNQIGDRYYFGDDDKKKDSSESKLEQPEIIFHRMFHHYELFIEGASPEQVVNYIKENISASFWYLHIYNKIAYDVDHTRTKFYDPNKDNTVVYGIVFHGIRYELEKKENGVLTRRNGVKIPEMFTVSIISGGLGDKIKLQVNFDTQIQDVCGFFDVMKKELKKLFVIKEKRESRIL